MDLHYYVSLWNFSHYANAPSLERIMEQVRQAGYGIEVTGSWRDERDLFDACGRRRLTSALQGMPVSLHTAGARTFEAHEKQIDAAAYIGATVVVLHPDDLYADAAQRTLNTDLAHRVVEHAGSVGVRVALENGPLEFLSDARDQVDGLFFCLDVGHVVVRREPMSGFLDALKHRIIHLHLQDVSLEPARSLRFPGGAADHFALGAGGVPRSDWQLLFETLGSVGYDGAAVFEIQPWNPLHTAAMGREFVQRFTEPVTVP